MTMVEHLRELRSRLVFSALAFVTISVIVFFFYDPIEEFLRQPLCGLPKDLLGTQGCELSTLKVTGGFSFRIKLTSLLGLALTSPVWLYQLYAFVVPALTPKEKRYSLPFILSSVALFLLGSAFAYLTLPKGLEFLLRLGGEDINPLLGAEEYLNFVGLILLAFGVTFELPLILIFLGLVGVVSVDQLRAQRRLAFVLIFVLAAVVTPSQDPYTMTIMALPLYGFYELTIVILRRLTRNRPPA
jgi:sec-independent protein translocase protein TatC